MAKAKQSKARPDDAIRTTPFMCHHCGYMMDCVCEGENGPTAPMDDGDLSMCLNCGFLYVWRTGKWSPLSAGERDGLPRETKAKLFRMQMTRLDCAFPDLAKRGGHV